MKYVPRRKGERRSVWMDLGDKHGGQTDSTWGGIYRKPIAPKMRPRKVKR